MKELKILSNGREKGGAVHSNHYSKYFEGYEYAVETSKGKSGKVKKKIRRVYVKDYHKQALTDKQWAALRVFYIFLFLFSAAFFVFGSAQPTDGNMEWYAAFACFLSTAALLILAVMLVSYIAAHRMMTKHEYPAATNRVKRYSLLAFAALILETLATAVYILLHPGYEIWQNIAVLCCYVFAAAAVFAVNRIENKVGYVTVRNDNKVPAGGFAVE